MTVDAEVLARALYDAHVAELVDGGEIECDDADDWGDLADDAPLDGDPNKREWRDHALRVLRALSASPAPVTGDAPVVRTLTDALEALRGPGDDDCFGHCMDYSEYHSPACLQARAALTAARGPAAPPGEEGADGG